MENTFQSLFIIDQCRTTKVAKIFLKDFELDMFQYFMYDTVE